MGARERKDLRALTRGSTRKRPPGASFGSNPSGFPIGFGGDFESVSRAQFLKRALAPPLRAAPGTQEIYSNAGYAILAAVWLDGPDIVSAALTTSNEGPATFSFDLEHEPPFRIRSVKVLVGG